MILQDFVALRIPSQFVMAVTPFKAKAEERAKLCKKDEESPDRPAKRMCNAYEKQIAKMPTGDLTTAKEHPAFPLSMYIYIYMYMYTHIYIYIRNGVSLKKSGCSFLNSQFRTIALIPMMTFCVHIICLVILVGKMQFGLM